MPVTIPPPARGGGIGLVVSTLGGDSKEMATTILKK